MWETEPPPASFTPFGLPNQAEQPLPTFIVILADANARLGANAVCYSFIAADFHHLLPAGFSGAPVCLNFARSKLCLWYRHLLILTHSS